jgi:hypothetical protein
MFAEDWGPVCKFTLPLRASDRTRPLAKVYRDEHHVCFIFKAEWKGVRDSIKAKGLQSDLPLRTPLGNLAAGLISSAR